MSISYREWQAEPDLAPWVECCWITKASGPSRPGAHRALPDGCMDLIFDLGSGGGARVVGTMTRPLLVRRQGGTWTVMGVRMRPGGLPELMGLGAHELTDAEMGGDDLPGSGLDDVAGRLAEALGPEDAFAVLRSFLLQRASSPGRPANPRFRAARALVERHGGSIAVARLLRAGPGTWSRVALRAGYYDQAHFNRDFSAWAGVTPGAFLQERSAVAFVQDTPGPGGEIQDGSGPREARITISAAADQW